MMGATYLNEIFSPFILIDTFTNFLFKHVLSTNIVLQVMTYINLVIHQGTFNVKFNGSLDFIYIIINIFTDIKIKYETKSIVT
jgi:hypothetical protein